MGIVRLTVQIASSSTGSPGVNVWHFRTAADQVNAEELALASEQLRLFYDRIKVRFLSNTVISMREQGLIIPGETEVVAVPTWSVTGTGNDFNLPPATALVVNWRTANVSRRGRGRTFLGPLGVNGALDSNGSPTLALLTAVQTSATALITAFQGAGDGSFGVWSPTDGVIRDFTASYIRDQFAVLRSRRD